MPNPKIGDMETLWKFRPRCGLTVYIGRGWTFHLSTEDGFQRERAPHRTLRLGIVFARRS